MPTKCLFADVLLNPIQDGGSAKTFLIRNCFCSNAKKKQTSKTKQKQNKKKQDKF